MKNIFEINAEIEKITNPVIEYHHHYQNIMFFGDWVSEIDYTYFIKWQETIKKKINDIADLDSPSKVKFLKVFHQDVLQKYNEQLKLNFNELDTLKAKLKQKYVSEGFIRKPKKKSKEVYYSPDSHDDFDYILTKMSEIFELEKFDIYNDDECGGPEGLKDILQDEVLSKLKVEDDQLESLYSYVHLSVCLELTRDMLKNITQHLDSIVNYIKKLENFEEDKLTLDEVYDNDPNNLKLEFKINKLDVALFYRVFHDVGIIEVDNKNQKNPYTNLKKYIDSSNMYYMENKKVDKVKNINKEFSKFLNDNKYEKHEINLIELLISKLKSKKEEIEANSEEGLL
ncbi:MAG: hypothetical protein K8F54_11700 [Altibacter sp.]|uniref:hypothetical protein n=1 Tax=Altibacter sp. TaxID=2024823 RepID=UPI001DD15639|nr:hypothetical protein [Altibacter sp.]MBZ0328263.1 hypothetical protein [Altibacter sp.]